MPINIIQEIQVRDYESRAFFYIREVMMWLIYEAIRKILEIREG